MSSDDLLLFATVALVLVGIVAAVLASYLYLKNVPPFGERRQPPQRTGTGFETGAISPRIQRVRQDYLLALHCRPHPLFHSRALLDAARESIGRLSYFQKDRDETGEE